MSTFSVYVMGDLMFANEVLVSVARMFNPSHSGMGGASPYDNIKVAAKSLILIMLFLSSFKYILDPEKSPFPIKEFAFAIVSFVLFVGDTAPRVDVELHSLSDPLISTVVPDVPMIVALPPYVASNLFGGLRDMMRNEFSPPGMDVNSPPDPLGALARFHSMPITPEVNSAGAPGFIDFKRTMRNFIHDCYITDQLLGGGNGSHNFTQLYNTTIDQIAEGLVVTYPHFYTETFLNSSDPNGDYQTCEEAHTAIVGLVNNPTYQNLIIDLYQRRGVTPDQITMANQLLTGTPGPDPAKLMAGRFVAYATADVLTEIDSPFIDKMVFEAMQQRVYQQAGERSLFMNYMIPMITMFEMFAFYIAPIIVLLSVLGGTGYAMIGKYLYLVLFINLWGFVKVFVDLYTYMAAERAFSATPSVTADNPFTLGAFPSTIAEIEGMLGVASALTAAIPMLSMFLLYGGVHSLMGVMSSINPTGKGNVDSSNAAPTVASSWNNAKFTQGTDSHSYNPRTGQAEQNVQSSDSGRWGSINHGASYSNAQTSAAEIANQRVTSSEQSYTESSGKTVSDWMKNDSIVSGSETKSWDNQNVQERAVSIANQIKESTGIDTDESRAYALNVARESMQADFNRSSTDASIGASGEIGFPGAGGKGGGISMGIKHTNSYGSEAAEKEAKRQMSNFEQSHKIRRGELLDTAKSDSENNAERNSKTDSTSFSTQESGGSGDEVRSALSQQDSMLEKIAQNRSVSEKIGQISATSLISGSSHILNQESLAPIVSKDAVTDFYDKAKEQGFDKFFNGNSVDDYMKRGAERAGSQEQAAYGAMHEMYQDIMGANTQDINDEALSAKAKEEWADSVLDDVTDHKGPRAGAQETGALRAMKRDYGELHDVLKPSDEKSASRMPDANKLEGDAPKTDKADDTKGNISQAKEKAQETEANASKRPQEADYQQDNLDEKQAERAKKAKEAIANRKEAMAALHHRLDNARMNVDQEGQQLDYGFLSGDKGDQVAGALAEKDGYRADAISNNINELTSSTGGEIAKLMDKVANGDASEDDLQKLVDYGETLDFLANGENGGQVLNALTDDQLSHLTDNAQKWGENLSRHDGNSYMQASEAILQDNNKGNVPNAVAMDALNLVQGNDSGSSKSPGYNFYEQRAGWESFDAYSNAKNASLGNASGFTERPSATDFGAIDTIGIGGFSAMSGTSYENSQSNAFVAQMRESIGDVTNAGGSALTHIAFSVNDRSGVTDDKVLRNMLIESDEGIAVAE
ncbi:MAG: hypothetical protein CMF12_08910, partial [Idiomarina sp.]|uniref:conjugal transfer protein TraG N-terminal domain-containing protein n=1 Tax=Idiomarina sp. TaxID=1874361 RepID=UPI000C583AEB